MGPYYLCKAKIKYMTTIHVLSREHLTPDMIALKKKLILQHI